jgi:hypothetical protein
MTILFLLTSKYIILLAVVVSPGQPQATPWQLFPTEERDLCMAILMSIIVFALSILCFKVVGFINCSRRRHQQLQDGP